MNDRTDNLSLVHDPNGVSFVSQSKQNDCEQCENNTECEKK